MRNKDRNTERTDLCISKLQNDDTKYTKDSKTISVTERNRKDCGNSGNNAVRKDVGMEVCTLGIPDAVDCNISNKQKASKSFDCERIWNNPNGLMHCKEIWINPCFKSLCVCRNR